MNEVRDRFAAAKRTLGPSRTSGRRCSPLDPCLGAYQKEYRWLTQVYESVKPPSGNGKLLWHALGAKTIELINENIHLESVRDDIETPVWRTPASSRIFSKATTRPSAGRRLKSP